MQRRSSLQFSANKNRRTPCLLSRRQIDSDKWHDVTSQCDKRFQERICPSQLCLHSLQFARVYVFTRSGPGAGRGVPCVPWRTRSYVLTSSCQLLTHQQPYTVCLGLHSILHLIRPAQKKKNERRLWGRVDKKGISHNQLLLICLFRNKLALKEQWSVLDDTVPR